MLAIAFVDLDDTLFQTMRKCPPGVPAEALRPVGYARDGAPLGFSTPRQANFLAWLSQSALLVPVTARSRDALERVRIGWAAAICAHGGLILDGAGQADRSWSDRMAAEAEAHRDQLAGLADAVRREAKDRPLSVRILAEGDVPLYLLVKHRESDADALAAIVAAVAPQVPAGWTIHRNDNNAALLPPFLGKHHAVRFLLPELRHRFPDVPAIGIGDSLTDAPFMALCDFAMTPTGSQLAGALLAASD